MINYNPKSWFSLIFQFHKSDTFRILLPNMILLGLITGGLVYAQRNFFVIKFSNTTIFHSILGFILSMLLVFRINSAYDRWWEGRKAWGSFVNNSRGLALKLNAFLSSSNQKVKNELGVLVSNYIIIVKDHLQDNSIEENIHWIDCIDKNAFRKANHKPNFIAKIIFQKINTLYLEKQISDTQFLLINEELKSFTDNTGICERIKSTPIPFAYSLFLKKVIFMYVITMPLAFSIDFRYWAIPIVCIIFYAFASLEIISEEIEDPFGNDANDLPTDELAEKIKGNIQEILS